MSMNFIENVCSFETLILEETLSTWTDRKKEEFSGKSHRENECHVDAEMVGLTYLQDKESES